MVKKQFLLILALLLLTGMLGACSSGTTSTETSSSSSNANTPSTNTAEEQKDDSSEYFKGKTITFIVPYNPGGGYDTVARSLAPKLEELTGAKLVVKNLPGGGGNLGTNTLFNSKNDGLTIGILNGTQIVNSDLFGSESEGVQYDIDRFSYLGRVNEEDMVVYTKNGGNYKSIEDLMKSEQPITFAVGAPTDNLFAGLVIMQEALGIPFEIIPGYSGSAEMELAVLNGEVDGTYATLPQRIAGFKSGDFQPIGLVLRQSEELPEIPVIADYIEGEENNKLFKSLQNMTAAGRVIAAPPDLDEGKRKFLEDTLNQILTDPKIVEEWEKADRPINWMDGKEYSDLMADLKNNTPSRLGELLEEERATLK
ncbi:tripartite tricarboxylate transporter substrate-binding protein [Bacillus sp. Marseille-P3661]|uniref:tripartite tricarboxylate transporter substrate-binding protein n=1 Tax=Bacillus sp. Marseille-P3661 TaxID=1936234 RepID=UPI000C8311AF|nr:tripartite tricarboxylate transporter substrate-binding protein [Bacillus sp. Marseille-P3661]